VSHTNGKGRPRPKPTGKTPGGKLVPQAHGGAIRQGGNPGNVGGTGRPKDELREKFIGLAVGKGVPFLDRLLDGKIRIRLVHVCEHCGKKATEPRSDVELEELVNGIRASVDQRLKALDPCLRYGLGTKDELDIRSHPDVQKFIAVHARATREIAGDETYHRIAERVQELAA
jgi:hypothetical protein